MANLGSFSISKATLPKAVTISNEVVALASTEQSYAFPANTKKILIKNRNTPGTNGIIQYSYTATESATNYRTLGTADALLWDDIGPTGTLTLYFQSPKSGVILEIESWA